MSSATTTAPEATNEDPKVSSSNDSKKMKSAPASEELELLMSTCGKYSVKTKFDMGDGKTMEGEAESVRTAELGGNFLVEQYTQTWDGMTFIGRQTSGFNGEVFQTCWVDNMSKRMYFSESSPDLEREPNEFITISPAPYKDDRSGKMKKTRSITKVKDQGKSFTFQTFEIFEEDGKETLSMFFEYTRVD